MKTTLNIEQSARLIELGVDPKLASIKRTHGILNIKASRGQITKIEKIFTLTDLLSILPKEIDGYHLEIGTDRDEWYVEYNSIKLGGGCFFAPELIDALNQLAIWLLTEKKINLNQKDT